MDENLRQQFENLHNIWKDSREGRTAIVFVFGTVLTIAGLLTYIMLGM